MKTLITLLLSVSVLSASVGKISLSIGDSKVLRGAIVIAAKTNMPIEEKDEIFTKNGKVQMIFNDKTIITIGKNTNVKVSKYLDDGKQSKASFSIPNGAFKIITGAIGKASPEKFKIKTKTATIGIRGTIILGGISKTYEKIGCIDGEIDVVSNRVSSSNKTPKKRVLKAGQMLNVSEKNNVIKPIKTNTFSILSRSNDAEETKKSTQVDFKALSKQNDITDKQKDIANIDTLQEKLNQLQDKKKVSFDGKWGENINQMNQKASLEITPSANKIAFTYYDKNEKPKGSLDIGYTPPLKESFESANLFGGGDSIKGKFSVKEKTLECKGEFVDKEPSGQIKQKGNYLVKEN